MLYDTIPSYRLIIDVLTELKQHYHSICESDGWPRELMLKYERDVFQFEKRIVAVENDLRMQQSESETLLRLLSDLKSLVRDIH